MLPVMGLGYLLDTTRNPQLILGLGLHGRDYIANQGQLLQKPQAHQDLLLPAKDLWHTKTCCHLLATCTAQPLKEPWVACELGEAPHGLRAKQVLKKAVSYISDFVYYILHFYLYISMIYDIKYVYLTNIKCFCRN